MPSTGRVGDEALGAGSEVRGIRFNPDVPGPDSVVVYPAPVVVDPV